QPSAAKPYVAQPVSPQDLPVDYSGFIAVIFGIAGVMFRVLPLPLDLSSYKLSSWLAIIFCAQSLANMKNVENDLKQISMAMMLGASSRILHAAIQGCFNQTGPAEVPVWRRALDWLTREPTDRSDHLTGGLTDSATDLVLKTFCHSN
ncbi:hypothetical protein Gotri_008383, partial [Gossypium trilobum]|nr:hypothetical protein [Gossypium trilobum]